MKKSGLKGCSNEAKSRGNCPFQSSILFRMVALRPFQKVSKSLVFRLETASTKAKLCRQHIYNIRMIPGASPHFGKEGLRGYDFIGDWMCLKHVTFGDLIVVLIF